jgi:hypothetical protein
MTEQPPHKILQQGDVLRMEISSKYATIQIQPNGDEEFDTNFPRNLHNAAELFLKCGLVPNAVRLKECTDSLLDMYANDPSKAVKLGRGSVCWKCGYCGIPKEYSDNQKEPGPCLHCQETIQVNWVRVTQPNSDQDLPWIERAAVTEQEKTAEQLAKRAAVEARVAEALKEREEASKRVAHN